MSRSFSQEARSDSHKIGETRYRMSHLPSTTAIARTLLLAGILLAVTVGNLYRGGSPDAR